MNKETIVMIPGAGRGSRMLSLTADMPKVMLPINNRPIISWHLDTLINEGITKVGIIVGYKKEKLIDFVDRFYGDKLEIYYIEQTELKGLAHAVKLGIDHLNEKIKLSDKNLFIILGDTIVKDKLSPKFDSNRDFVGYQEVDDYKRWCLLNTNEDGDIKSFIDKPDTDPGTRKAVIGTYYFSDIHHLADCIDTVIEKDIKIKGEYQLSSAMDLYNESYTLCAVEFKEWFDCGDVETFNKTRQNITRHFNSITITDDNTIIKTSDSNPKKIKQEIGWYLNVPNKLRVYLPQLIDYSTLSGKEFYELEYVNLTPMQELFLYDMPNKVEWEQIIQLVFTMVDRFRIHSLKSRFNVKEHLTDMLIDKLSIRLEEFDKEGDEWYKRIKNRSVISINGKNYKNLPLIKERMDDYIKEMIVPESAQYWQVVHGDLFFGNMLYDINTNILKIIDPRGNFGIDGVYGDIRYDMAKLMHSIVGKYDFIVNGLYSITKEDGNCFEYIMYDSGEHDVVVNIFETQLKNNGFNLEQIKVITGILFLSMIPLHSDNKENQKMFYLKGIEILNQVF